MAREVSKRHRLTRRHFLLAAAGLGLGSLSAAVGCGGSQPQAPAPPQAPSPTQAPAASSPTQSPAQPKAAAPAPTKAPAAAPTAAPAVAKARQDVMMGIGSDVVSMDMRITGADQAKSQVMHVVEPLIWPDDTGKPQGILAAAWEPVVDPPGWRFKLRPGIKFSNGEPLDARSLKYSIESVLEDTNKSWVRAVSRARLAMVKGVKVEDDLSGVILTDGFSRELVLQGYQNVMMPPKYAAEKGQEFGQNPVGTGHYKFVEYRSKSYLKLEADPGYHGSWGGPTRNNTLTFRFLTENATRVAALEAGEVHLIDNLPPDTVDRIKRNPNLDVMATPSTRPASLFFHSGRPPFENLKARQAVAYGIDREAIVSKIMGGMAQVATAPFPPGTLGVVGETFPPFTFDLKKAKQYFAEAGLTNGTKIKLGGPVGRYVNDKQIVAAVGGMLADVGFAPEMEQLEFNTYWNKVTTQGYYDLFYAGLNMIEYDPAPRRAYFGDASDEGITHFVGKNKRLAELWVLLDTAAAQQEADRYAKELAHLFWDALPSFNIMYEPNITGVSKKLKGWKTRPDGYIFVWGAYLD